MLTSVPNIVPVGQEFRYYGGFVGVVFVLLFIDLVIAGRGPKILSLRTALKWTAVWVGIGTSFGGLIFAQFGSEAAWTYWTGFVIEQSLSIDNLFVFLLVFNSFRIPTEYQHRVLFWGIIGALVMRAICIVAGVAALESFAWLNYVFALILIVSGIKTLKEESSESDPSKGWFIQTVRKIVPVTAHFDGTKFLTRYNGSMHVTPLFLTLIVIEISDVMFAVDSIPAVLAITKDPFLVITSNVFAVLGLRAAYFVLAQVVELFHYLKYALSFILVFVGVKMMLGHHIDISPTLTLAVISTAFAIAIGASLMRQRQMKRAPKAPEIP